MTKVQLIERAAVPAGDVIFVHGLGGDASTTWCFEKSNSWRNWIKENRPDLNIWSIGYRVDPTEWTGGAMPLSDRALNILALLDNKSIGSRPIVFVAHSMGGLLVKEMLRHALTVTVRFKHVVENTKAVIFFATPHTGSSLADIAIYFGFLVRHTVAVSEMASQQPRLRDLNLWFRNNFGALGLKISIFYETQETNGVRVVNETSADPGIPLVSPIPIDANHVTITKPESYDGVVVGQTLKAIDEAIPSTAYQYSPDRVFSADPPPPTTSQQDSTRGISDRLRIRYALVGLVSTLVATLALWAYYSGSNNSVPSSTSNAVTIPTASPTTTSVTIPTTTPAPPGMSTLCRFVSGPRAGQTIDYTPMAAVPVGTHCQDGVMSFGVVVPRNTSQ